MPPGFQPQRVRFAPDLIANLQRSDARSRFSCGFGQPLVETDIRVRSLLALPAAAPLFRESQP